MRYAKLLGSVATIKVWMVIETDEVPPHEVLGYGFEGVPAELTEDEIESRYGVKVIYHITDARLLENVQ